MLLIQNQKPKNYFEITQRPFVFDYPKLIDAIEYLNFFVRDEPELIFSSDEAFLALVFIAKNISAYKEQINFEIFIANNFDETFTRLFMRLYEKRGELNFERGDGSRNVQVFAYLLFVINDTLLKSIKFCHLFVQNAGLSACLLFLGDEQFITQNLQTKIAAFDSDILPARLADILTMIITNLVMTCDAHKHKWFSLRAVEILLRIASLSPSSKFNAYTTIPFILNDEQIESSFNVEINSIIDVLIEMMANARKEFDRGDFNRLSFQIVLKDRAQHFSIHFVRHNNGTEISLDYLLDHYDWNLLILVN